MKISEVIRTYGEYVLDLSFLRRHIRDKEENGACGQIHAVLSDIRKLKEYGVFTDREYDYITDKLEILESRVKRKHWKIANEIYRGTFGDPGVIGNPTYVAYLIEKRIVMKKKEDMV